LTSQYRGDLCTWNHTWQRLQTPQAAMIPQVSFQFGFHDSCFSNGHCTLPYYLVAPHALSNREN